MLVVQYATTSLEATIRREKERPVRRCAGVCGGQGVRDFDGQDGD